MCRDTGVLKSKGRDILREIFLQVFAKDLSLAPLFSIIFLSRFSKKTVGLSDAHGLF